ncbi:hypothetical protein KKD62_01430 [Patescibacteria group bacterium]|nr:hypothetical protein [Patescibacteria group bacterium]MBU1931384.1 hypothetical protein [Patescibacteria group bacterium]
MEDNISLYLDNVAGGQVYIDEFSIREVLSAGSLGGELIRSPRADVHTYVDQRPAAYFDQEVVAGEQNYVFYKYVVQDKNDWIPNHLHNFGMFVNDGDGYYQANGTRNRWLQNAWWRYLVARWGYSTAIHSWELNNEGPPDDGSGSHARAAQDFSKFMHDYDSHPHLAMTSFWCCWRPTFWGDEVNFPDIDYADIHQYINTDDVSSYDLAQWIYDNAAEYFQSQVGKPIQIGEIGIQGAESDWFNNQTDPTWWHNLVWAGINHTGVSYPNYWYPNHLDQINYQTEIGRFTKFIKDIPLTSGYYKSAGVQVSNSNLRAWGQKDTVNGGLYLWVQNKNNTWKNRRDGVNIPAQSGTITVGGFQSGKSFQVEDWNTWTGTYTTQTKIVDSQGNLIFSIFNLQTDKAIRILSAGSVNLPGDVDHDGDVDKDDAVIVLSNYGQMNSIDFAWVRKDWGQ